MLQYDLTRTNLAQSNPPSRIPTEGELLAVMMGLILAEDCPFEALRERVLMLTSDNQEHVAQLIEQHVWPLTHDIGSGKRLLARLDELVGLQISSTF